MAHLISVKFGLAECLDADLLEGDDDKTDEHVEEDEGHDAHVEKEEDEGVGGGIRFRAHWVVVVLE